MTTGFGGDPAARTTDFGPAGANFGRLARMNASGKWSLQEDLGAYEAATNPTGDEVDTNPYGILALPLFSIRLSESEQLAYFFSARHSRR